MSPEQISAVTSLVAVLRAMSSWPFGLVMFLLVVGPWVMALMLFYFFRKRFEAVVNMYESNVRLVEKYEQVATDLKDVIILNTQTITTLVETVRARGS